MTTRRIVQDNCEGPGVAWRADAPSQRVAIARLTRSPHPSIKGPIALTAWTRIETLDDVEEGRVTRFLEAYRGIDHHQ